MPTWSAKNDLQRGGFSHFMKTHLRTLGQYRVEEGLTVLNDSGEIDRRVKEILALAKDYDVVVSTGHLSPEEAVALGAGSQENGLEKVDLRTPG